ncbi:calcium-translocating P-type ATPase, PMCA-type [Syntrophobotulus glycolicus DSM 8271]|uniref:P-type Ca(2+) transporter n=1 Tax=Syntrophobotulus glycolicus (strain DSM 8271 / FlGlyR) TaxID=645991 RepID=F0SY88_SYNGF|nr:calcium-translocating P-type ATPase, SERCA-type [Syntrophobotulus glycolicus]ADY55923.1 calcium-translocating P-type ATPase, PMCA-type [Syntrophobotulus glycolicus DSM 8271]
MFHNLSENEVIRHFGSTPEGLTDEEAGQRIKQYGKNEIPEGKKKTLAGMFLEQFKSIMILILLIAAVISGLMHELTDTYIILVVIVLNAVLGVIQESKAEKALEALQKMSSPFVKVKRNGKVREVKTEEIVPGDMVIIEAGDYVPADLRLMETASLKVEEAALTGESLPVEKQTAKLEEQDLILGDRINMAYSGSSVTYGRGNGIVTATGINTEVGKIAQHLAREDTQSTPLQKKLEEMSKYLSVGIITVSIVIFFAGILQGREYFEMFLTAVSLAVAAIPEGLPAVVTIVLAIGVQKMARRNAIIRKLSAVETLGGTEIICSDKTGTLTQNQMTVKKVFVGGKLLGGTEIRVEEMDVRLMIETMVLCNDTKISTTDQKISLVGDPTEKALVSFAEEKGLSKEKIEQILPRVAEIPFDSERKLMTVINRHDGRYRMMTKGAPDVLLERCTKVFDRQNPRELTAEDGARIIQANKEMASKALRVLAVAYKDIDQIEDPLVPENIEGELVFIGLVGMIDPLRPEALEAVKTCAQAGIRPIMITGDHKDTAAAIAKELGMIKDDHEVITGSQLNKMSDEEFQKQVNQYSVYARVSPEHKVKIVEAWQKQGKVVAMTGDGVNDAPALKASDIGIGMGITGTDVSKGVSNMILADDNFATIVIAVEEGRKIYSNIRKSIQFLLSSNLGEVFTLFVATMLNWTILQPIHILWVNLVTDTLPALALGVEQAEEDIMKNRPRKSTSSFFSEGVGVSIFYQGICKGLITLLIFYLGSVFYTQEIAMTMAFATLGLIQLAHSLNVRSNSKSIFRIGLLSNRYLIAAIVFSAVIQLFVIVVPYFHSIFKVSSLNAEQWLMVLLASAAIIPVVEIGKMIARRKPKQ